MNSSSVEPNPRVTFRVCHEDEDLLVVEKPGRVVTQPGVGHQHDTLLNGLFASYADRLQNLGEARDFGLVHRLDRETSGLVVVALSPRAYDAMREQFAQRRVSKYYWAVHLAQARPRFQRRQVRPHRLPHPGHLGLRRPRRGPPHHRTPPPGPRPPRPDRVRRARRRYLRAPEHLEGGAEARAARPPPPL